MLIDLATLTIDSFLPHEKTIFKMQIAEGQAIDVKLLSCTPGRPRGKDQRPGFSLIFESSEAAVRAQGSYVLSHETTGAMQIFVVPVGKTAHGIQYEAVFG